MEMRIGEMGPPCPPSLCHPTSASIEKVWSKIGRLALLDKMSPF